MTTGLWLTAAEMGLWIAFLLQVTPVMVWIERRGSALIQDRLGPNRVGPLGLFQSLADALKFIYKEDIVPAVADRSLYLLAPLLALVPSLTTFVVLPFGPDIEIGGETYKLMVVEAETGILLFLALASLGVYSLVMAGYASNNKFSLLGSIRASSQMISYELALGISAITVLLPVGSLRLDEVVLAQQGTWFGFLPQWNLFPQALGFLVFMVAAFAETNRLPFDLPEAESELVAGYHTEYSAMRFALFFMGEYMSMATLSALAATLFLGGWHLPGVSFTYGPWLNALVGFGILAAKILAILLFFVWVRWSFPRFRFDQLLRLGWKVLLPLAILNFVLVGALTVAGVL
ncbi:MAG: NADH-quinone oxidoreductase subunit NuoH [Thermoanaerobaculia bacterium]|nr:NADH-quinone oxidoreductase subunit NuoH [Thermoanaerobaculia bacterium]